MQKTEFSIGRYKLAPEPKTDAWYVSWWDSVARRQRRKSLGTADLEEAKVRLAAFVLERDRPKNAEWSDVHLATLMVPYIERRTDRLASAEQARISASQVMEFWGNAARVSELTRDRQRDFVRHQHAKRGHAPSTISRTLSVLSAAMGRAVREGELVAAPKIILAQSEIREILDHPEKDDQERRLSIQEIAAFVDAIPTRSEHVFRFTVLALTTLARPDAITDLSPRQWESDIGILRLNPPGRRQTKKRRPVIPVAACLAGWLRTWDTQSDRYVYTGAALDPKGRPRGKGARPVANLKKAVRATALRAGLLSDDEWTDDRTVTPYTFRRSMARLLRARQVPMADIGAMLGHSARGMRITEEYADFDPAELQRPRAGIDQIMTEVEEALKAMKSARSVFTPPDATENLPKAAGGEVVTLRRVR